MRRGHETRALNGGRFSTDYFAAPSVIQRRAAHSLRVRLFDFGGSWAEKSIGN